LAGAELAGVAGVVAGAAVGDVAGAAAGAFVSGAVQPYKSDDATTPVRMTGNDLRINDKTSLFHVCFFFTRLMVALQFAFGNKTGLMFHPAPLRVILLQHP
jgi:CheY-specific phosphatase CheX